MAAALVIEEVERGNAPQLAALLRLLDAYVAWLDVPLDFQDFAGERADPLQRFEAPGGGVWLARLGVDTVGVIALRRLSLSRGEIKRLFVEPACRGHGVAQRLAETALARARSAGYADVVLDTFPDRMAAAVRVYERLGFRPCAPYYANPHTAVGYYRLDLETFGR